HLHDADWPTSVPSVQRRPPDASPSPGDGAYRVLTPARTAQRHEIPYAASALAAIAERNGRRAVLTYALAEETASGTLTASLAVRVADANKHALGFAAWHNDRFKSAIWRSPVGELRR